MALATRVGVAATTPRALRAPRASPRRVDARAARTRESAVPRVVVVARGAIGTPRIARGGVAARRRDGGRAGAARKGEEGSIAETAAARADDEDDRARRARPTTTTTTTTTTTDTDWDWLPKLGLATLGGAGVFGTNFQLDGPASTLEAVAVLASIIFVHECGHFFAARLQDIHVSKFSIGFGPNLLSYQGPEVEYSLRAIPLGGFVAFPDDDPDCPFPEDDPDLLRNRPMKDRAIVVSAGVLANVAFALAILTTQVNTVGFR